MQSGTLVPAARKVMPMMTSGIPSVYPVIVTCRKGDMDTQLSPATLLTPRTRSRADLLISIYLKGKETGRQRQRASKSFYLLVTPQSLEHPELYQAPSAARNSHVDGRNPNT